MLSQMESTIVNSERVKLTEMEIAIYSKLELQYCKHKIHKPVCQAHIGNKYNHSSWIKPLKVES